MTEQTTDNVEILEDDAVETELDPLLEAVLSREAVKRNTGFAQAVDLGEASRVDKTLNDRHNTHGLFMDVAHCSQSLKEIIQLFLEQNDKILPADQQESLDLICTKIARIVLGDNYHADSWHDIAGYAQLVVDHLEGKSR